VLEEEIRLGTYQRFDWSQDTREITFSEAGSPRVVAAFQFVGTLSKNTGTWLWSWANESLDPAVKQQLLEVQRFGVAHDLPPILQDEWPADEADGWDMTALAANLLQAVGAYRAPGSSGHSFLVLTRVEWVKVAVRSDA
jgi:hypothetical protein